MNGFSQSICRGFAIFTAGMLTAGLTTSCSQGGSSTSSETPSVISPAPGAESTPTPSPTPKPSATPSPTPTPKPSTPTPTPAPTPTPDPSGFKALWNGQHADSANWTRYVQESVNAYGDALFRGPADVEDFCPRYSRLGTQDKLNFWVQLIAAMAKYESGFNPASRYTESTMGIDPITGKQVVSEGLLQLSYQDENNYRSVLPAGVCDFDFAGDKQYGITDLRRSILNPRNNLTCGVGILNRQVERYGKIAVSTGAYWSVIKTGSSYNKLSQIRAATKSLVFCQ